MLGLYLLAADKEALMDFPSTRADRHQPNSPTSTKAQG
jgi:hypothetical protein